jgi:hypothetical protein
MPESSQVGLSLLRRRSLLVSKVKEEIPALFRESTSLVMWASGEPSATRMRAVFSETERRRTRGGAARAVVQRVQRVQRVRG